MRLPLNVPFDSRDGAVSVEAQLTNTLPEEKEEQQVVVKRPGLGVVASLSTAANGNGLVCFDDTLVSIFGATLYAGMQVVPATATAELAVENFPAPAELVYFGGKWYAFMRWDLQIDWAEDTPFYLLAESDDGLDWVYRTDTTGKMPLDWPPLVVGGALTLRVLPHEWDPDFEEWLEGDPELMTLTEAGVVTFPSIALTLFSPFAYEAPYFYGKARPGDPYQYARSTDRVTYTLGDVMPDSTVQYSFRFAGKLCVLSDQFSSGKAFVQTSEDGLTWTAPVYFSAPSPLSARVLGMAIVGEMLHFYVAPDTIYSTSDLVTFTSRLAPAITEDDPEWTQLYHKFWYNSLDEAFYLFVGEQYADLGQEPRSMLMKRSYDLTDWQVCTPTVSSGKFTEMFPPVIGGGKARYAVAHRATGTPSYVGSYWYSSDLTILSEGVIPIPVTGAVENTPHDFTRGTPT